MRRWCGYWQPEKWSGTALQQAIAKACATFNLKNPPLYYYGYSAGGQCANLFYFWRPESVRAVVIHACDVWSEAIAKLPSAAYNTAPFLITCGRDDPERFATSYTTAQRLREGGLPNAASFFRNKRRQVNRPSAKSIYRGSLVYLRPTSTTW